MMTWAHRPDGVRTRGKKDKLQLTPKGAMLAYEREALEYRILKLAKAIKFL